jgi:hypothetical protein
VPADAYGDNRAQGKTYTEAVPYSAAAHVGFVNEKKRTASKPEAKL